MGDPIELARRYEEDGADEIVFLDISATVEERGTILDIVQRTVERLSVPLTVGGGIRSVDDVARAIDAGATKVAINSAGVAMPELFTRASERFGTKAIVAAIDAKRVEAAPLPSAARYLVHTHGGRTATDLDVVDWAMEVADRGAGEILLTSIDRDGKRTGYDLELTRRVAEAVAIPVIASGGGGSAAHFHDAFAAGADGALAAGIFHDGTLSIREVKLALAAAGVHVRSPRGNEP